MNRDTLLTIVCFGFIVPFVFVFYAISQGNLLHMEIGTIISYVYLLFMIIAISWILKSFFFAIKFNAFIAIGMALLGLFFYSLGEYSSRILPWVLTGCIVATIFSIAAFVLEKRFAVTSNQGTESISLK